MKSTHVLAIVLISVSAELSGQVLVGPTAGLHLQTVSFGDKDNKTDYARNPTLGYQVGGTVAFQVRKRFFLQTSLLYSYKGKSIEGKQDLLLKNVSRYHYIDVPMLYTMEFKSTAGRSKVYKWYLGIGPSVNYWLAGKGKISNSELDENGISEQRYSVSFKGDELSAGVDEMTIESPNRFQFGISLAGGIIFEPYQFNRVMINLRIEADQSYLAKTDGIYQGILYQDELQLRNYLFVLSGSYLLDLRLNDRKKGKSTIKSKKKKR